MPTTFVLTLDTAAPVVTWGGTGGTTAGELLVVGYSINEPQGTAARVKLADNRSLAATVFSNRIEVLLPADTPAGLATVELDVADDVGNAATRTTTVLLSGAPAPPSAPPVEYPAPMPGVPGIRPRPRRPAPQRHETRTRIASRSTSRARAGSLAGEPSQVRTRVSTYVRVRTNLPQGAEVSRLVLQTLTTVRVRASDRVQIGARATSDRRRRDDPALLAILLVD